MTGDEYYIKVAKRNDWPADDLCDPPSDPTEACYVLIEHFLGDDWYCVMPQNDYQVITLAVTEILDKYPESKNRKMVWWIYNNMPMFMFTIANAIAAIINIIKG